MPTVAAGLRALPYHASELRTPRITLRPLTKDDTDGLHAAYQKRKDVVRYLRWEVHDHDEPSGHLAKRIALSSLSDAGDGIIFAVELAGAEGQPARMVGDISVFLKSVRNAQVEVGWVFHPAVHGRGLATEAAQAVLDLCFNTLGAHRVFAELDARNEASARLCGLLGMRQEALLRGRENVDGEWHDMAIYAILADEFAAGAQMPS